MLTFCKMYTEFYSLTNNILVFMKLNTKITKIINFFY